MQHSEEQKMIARLQGDVLALGAALRALICSLSREQLQAFAATHVEISESGKASLLGMSVPEETLQSYEAQSDAIRQLSA